MLPLVCNDALAILFMFDLTRQSTLVSVKDWYRQARGINKVTILFLFYFGFLLKRIIVDCKSNINWYQI